MPKLIDHEARERTVAEAAWRVLDRDGLKGVSVRAVAAEAGLAVGSLRRSFPTQSALMLACVQLVAANASERVESLKPSGDAKKDALAALLEVLPLDDVRRLEMEVWLVMTTAALSDPALAVGCAELDDALGALIAGVVHDLAAAGELGRGRRSRAETARLHALIDGVAMHLIKRPTEASQTWAVRLVREHLAEICLPVKQ